MNRLLMLLAAMLIVFSASAQKIMSDDTSSNGTRHIFCSKENVGSFTDPMKLFIGLSYSKPESGEGVYFLSVQLNCGEVTTIHKGGRMLIKTANGDVVELTTSMGGSDEVKSYSGVNVWEVSAQYAITPEQLDLIQSGITKIRIELGDSKMYDKEWKKDKVGKILAKEHKLITEALDKNHKTSFFDDF